MEFNAVRQYVSDDNITEGKVFTSTLTMYIDIKRRTAEAILQVIIKTGMHQR